VCSLVGGISRCESNHKNPDVEKVLATVEVKTQQRELQLIGIINLLYALLVQMMLRLLWIRNMQLR
jgi:hypothetical protein